MGPISPLEAAPSMPRRRRRLSWGQRAPRSAPRSAVHEAARCYFIYRLSAIGISGRRARVGFHKMPGRCWYVVLFSHDLTAILCLSQSHDAGPSPGVVSRSAMPMTFVDDAFASSSPSIREAGCSSIGAAMPALAVPPKTMGSGRAGAK